MNEFDWEVLQRKRIANSAKHKKNGSKSKKCSLPSDGMSHKEWKERNGKVMEYNLNKPMVWAVFKKMPTDLQRKYLLKLRNDYGATAKVVAEMLGIHPYTFYSWLKGSHADIFPRNGGRKNLVAWQAFLNGDAPEQEIAAPDNAIEPVETVKEETLMDVKPETAPLRKPSMTLDNFTLNFTGEFDPDAIRNSLAMILQKGQRVNIRVSCCVEPANYLSQSKE